MDFEELRYWIGNVNEFNERQAEAIEAARRRGSD
jgi:hypothetical protein